MSTLYPTTEMELVCWLDIKIENIGNHAVINSMIIPPGTIITKICVDDEFKFIWQADAIFETVDITKFLDPKKDLIKNKDKIYHNTYKESGFICTLNNKIPKPKPVTLLDDPLLEDEFHKANIKEINDQKDTIILQLCPVI